MCGARLDLGRLLYEELTLNPRALAAFHRLGIRFRRASPMVELPGASGSGEAVLHITRPLVHAAAGGGRLYEHFLGQGPRELRAYGEVDAEAREPRAGALSDAARRISDAKTALIEIPDLRGRPLLVVVEGGGD